jgi:hypothetical protein
LVGIDVRNNRGATGLSNFVIDGILRGLTESVVAGTTKSSVHYIVAVTHVFGITIVSNLMSQKLALYRETIAKANLIDACVVPPRVAKISNISAPNRIGSGEVLAVEEMNDIGIDVLASSMSNKTFKQPVGFGTDSFGASLAQKRSNRVSCRIAMHLQV